MNGTLNAVIKNVRSVYAEGFSKVHASPVAAGFLIKSHSDISSIAASSGNDTMSSLYLKPGIVL